MPWHLDGDRATCEGSDATWSAVVDRATGGFRLLGHDGEPVTTFASGDAYPNAGLAIRANGAWQALGAPTETGNDEGSLTLTWGGGQASARIDTDAELGVRWNISVPDAEAIALSLVAHAAEHFYGMGERFNKLDQRGDIVELWVKNGSTLR